MTEDEIEKMTQDIKDEEESSEDDDDSDSGIDFGTEHKIV
jgi:hypothetical protein